MRRWHRTPLFHFLLGGAALFWLVPRPAPPPAPVVVTAGDVSRLRQDYARETGREPTAADEAALVDKAIREELLFREALARGLDRHDRSVRNWLIEQMRVVSDDPRADPDELYAHARRLGLDRTDVVVRRILVQKMRLLAARLGETPPSETALAAFYAAHADEYRVPNRISFWHVFRAAPASRPEAIAAAETALEALRRRGGQPREMVQHGDSFPVSPHVVGLPPARIEQLFGAAVAAALVTEGELGRWIGPLRSPYGVHLVWVEARAGGSVPPLDTVRQRVLERWYSEARGQRLAALLDALATRHPLQVDSAAWQQRRQS